MAVNNCRNWAVFLARIIRKTLNFHGSKSTIAGLDRKINLGNLAAEKLPFATDSNGLVRAKSCRSCHSIYRHKAACQR